MAIEDHISKVLSDIQASIPKNLLKNAFKEVKLTPTVEFVVRKGLESDSVSEEKKRKLKNLLDSGELTKTKLVENHKILKTIDNYVGRQINQAIKEGRLPPRSEIKNLPNIKHFYDKTRENNKS